MKCITDDAVHVYLGQGKACSRNCFTVCSNSKFISHLNFEPIYHITHGNSNAVTVLAGM